VRLEVETIARRAFLAGIIPAMMVIVSSSSSPSKRVISSKSEWEYFIAQEYGTGSDIVILKSGPYSRRVAERLLSLLMAENPDNGFRLIGKKTSCTEMYV
jgi:hypothetical protein